MNKQRITGARLLACTAAILCVIGVVPGSAGCGGGRGGGAAAPDPNAPTPQAAQREARPDGLLASRRPHHRLRRPGFGLQVGDMFRRCTPFQSKTCMEWTNQSIDWVFMSTSRLGMNQPMYKPEHWNKVIELDQWTNKYDPVGSCLPLGIPRQGPPSRIFHTDTDITMIYPGGATALAGTRSSAWSRSTGSRMIRTGPTNTASWATRSAGGKATRSSSTRSGSPTRPGWRAAAGSTPTDAGRGEVHQGREPDDLRRHRRGPRGAAEAMGHADDHHADSAAATRSSASAEACTDHEQTEASSQYRH